MIKIIAAFMIFVAVVSSFASCNKSGNEPQNTPTDATTTVAPSTTTLPAGGEENNKPVSTKSPLKIMKEIAPDATLITPVYLCNEVVLNDVSGDSVIKAFTDEDFSIVDTTPIDGAKFETTVLLRNFDVVTVYSSKTENEVRVIWEKTTKSGLYMLSPNEETGKDSIIVAQIGTDRESERDNPLIGMCYVIKLSNGKAIIIDGGFNTNTCADNIYNALEAMDISSTAGQYNIEAWIITHGHGDHVGAIKKFSSEYATKANVSHIISAFPANDTVVSGGAKEQLSTSIFPSAKRVNPHAGIKYYFGNATISMFYTPDMIYAPNYTVENYNDSSLAFRVEGGDADVFFFGDAVEVAATKMINSYEASAFKSDVVQITHHGLYTEPNGHTWNNLKKVYEAIDADYAFLPMQSRFTSDGRNGRYTVMVQWGGAGFQISHVMNENDNHGISGITQQYYDAFVESVANGTNTHATLFGYDGVNKVVNENGLVTYLGANEIAPMVTVFEFSNGKVTLKTNEPLYAWLGAVEYIN